MASGREAEPEEAERPEGEAEEPEGQEKAAEEAEDVRSLTELFEQLGRDLSE